MNAHDQNSIYRTFKAMLEQPAEFTRKLSHDEQTELHKTDNDKYWRYVDWVFGRTASMTTRWARREFASGLDHDRMIDNSTAAYEGANQITRTQSST